MSAGTTGSGLRGGASSGAAVAGTSAGNATAGSTASRVAGGVDTGAATARLPNGGAGLLGRLYAGTLPAHTHEDEATGGLLDYARLVVASTAPPAPESPSDAFWLNPEEEA